MKRAWLAAPLLALAWLAAGSLQGERTVGPFRVAPDASWSGPEEGAVFGWAGWILSRPGATKHTLHLAQETSPFRDEKDRQRQLAEMARRTGEAHSAGFKASNAKLAGVDTVLARFVEGEETVFRYFPYNAERIFTVTLVIGKADSPMTDAGKQVLATLKLPDPPYKAPKKDFLSGLLGALDSFSKELDKINDVLSGKPPKETDPKGTKGGGKEGGDGKPPVDGAGTGTGNAVAKDDAVAVSVPWIRVDETGATKSEGLAASDRFWAAPSFPAPERPAVDALPMQPEIDLRELARTRPDGAARVAAAGLREMMGPMPAADLAKLQAKLAPMVAMTDSESGKYLESLIPLVQEQLGLRAAAATSAMEFDAAWLEARIAASLGAEEGVREALDIADRQRETLQMVQARSADLTVKGREIAAAPNPVARALAQASEYDATVKSIMAAIRSIKPADSPKTVKTIVWDYSGKLPAGWKLTAKTASGLEFERTKLETPKEENHWPASATAKVTVSFPAKIGGPNDKPASAAEAQLLLQEKFRSRPQGFTPNDMAVGLDKQGGIEGVSGFSIGEFKGSIADYAIWRRRGSWGGGYTPGYSGAGGEGWVFSEGYRIAFSYQVWTGACYDNCKMEWENAQATAAQREARAILASLNPKGTGVFETVPAENVAVGEDPVSKLPPALQDTVKMHAENIRFIKGTIQRLEKELAAEADPRRRAELQFELLHARSDVIAEEDLIQSALTGQIVSRRTPFDDYAQARFVESIRDNQQRMERFQRAQASLQRLAGMLPPGEAEEARRFIDRQIDRKAMAAMDFDKIRQVAEALNNKATGYFMGEQAKSEEKAAWAQFGLDTAQRLKDTADDSLLWLSLFGGRPAMVAYQAATGYLEGGPLESVLRTAAWCGTPAYVASEAVRGFVRVGPDGERAGWKGALENAATAYVIGKAFEYGVGKAANWAKGRVGAVAFTEAELAEFNRRRAAGEKTAKAFADAQAALTKAGKSGASAQEIRRLQERATKAAQAVNEDPHAKNFLKYRGDPQSQRAYNAHMNATHAEVEAKFHENMSRRGWDRAPMKEFRNASSQGSVGMDYDIGLDESRLTSLSRNGQPQSLRRWQAEAQQAWDDAYKQVTGRSAKRSWETVTTSAHAEAYKDLEWLSRDKSGIRKVWSQQAADVTRYKNWHNEASGLDKLTSLQENSRGTAKDIETKLLGLFWRNLPKNQASGAAMQNFRQKWEAIQKVLAMFGSNQIDPVTASDRIRRLTGGKDIPQVLEDAATMIESLGKNAGR